MCAINGNNGRYYQTLIVDGYPVNFMAHTGSPFTIIPESQLHVEKEIIPCPVIKCFDGNILPTKGSFTSASFAHGERGGVFDIFFPAHLCWDVMYYNDWKWLILPQFLERIYLSQKFFPNLIS